MSRMPWAACAAFFLASTALLTPLAAETSGASFDCRKASTPRERLTCASDAARKADLEMGKAYATMLNIYTGPQRKDLQVAQRQFNSFLDGICAVARARKPEQRAEASTCLAERMEERARLLLGLGNAEIGKTMRLETRLRTEFRLHPPEQPEDTPQGWITNDAVPVLVGAPEPVAQAFNAWLKQAIDPDKPLIGGRRSMIGQVTRSVFVTHASLRLLSLQINEHVETGTMVPDRDVGINFDLVTGKPVPLDAIFERSDEWRRVMAAALARDINRPDELPEHLDRILAGGKDVIWAFGPDKVNVSWRVMNPPAESADIAAGEIARFIKPDSPWKPTTR